MCFIFVHDDFCHVAAYTETVSFTTPDVDGFLNLTMSAGSDKSCYTGEDGPYPVSLGETSSLSTPVSPHDMCVPDSST